MSLVRVTDGPVSVEEHLAAVAHPAAGAVALSVGQVRDHDPSADGEVAALEYSAHPDAEEILGRLVAGTAQTDGVLGVAATHRRGLLPVGEIAIVVAVSTAHRTQAFRLCEDLVETVKKELPVWKREILADGRHHWVGLA